MENKDLIGSNEKEYAQLAMIISAVMSQQQAQKQVIQATPAPEPVLVKTSQTYLTIGQSLLTLLITISGIIAFFFTNNIATDAKIQAVKDLAVETRYNTAANTAAIPTIIARQDKYDTAVSAGDLRMARMETSVQAIQASIQTLVDKSGK